MRLFLSYLFWWPGQLVVRVRERGIASAQEVAGSIRILTGDLLWPSATRTTSCPGHPRKTSRSELRGIRPKRLKRLTGLEAVSCDLAWTELIPRQARDDESFVF